MLEEPGHEAVGLESVCARYADCLSGNSKGPRRGEI